MPNPTLRRLRRYFLDPGLLVAYLNAVKEGPKLFGRCIVTDLPDDAQVLAVDWSINRHCLTATVYHESFEEVPDGEEIPIGMDGYANIKKVWLVRGDDGTLRATEDIAQAASWRHQPPML